jgi:hypothetical protein
MFIHTGIHITTLQKSNLVPVIILVHPTFEKETECFETSVYKNFDDGESLKRTNRTAFIYYVMYIQGPPKNMYTL